MIECFSRDYPEAREKFLTAARTAGARLRQYSANETGPVWQGMALGQGLAGCRAALGGLRDSA